jgi:hypothetical protein
MPYALVASTLAVSSDSFNVTTSSITTTTASLLVVQIGDYDGAAAGTVSDSKSNTWTALTSYTDPGNMRCRLYYAANPTVGTGHTVSYLSANSLYQALVFAAFSGAALTSPFDVQNGASVYSGTPQPGSITPTQNNCLIVSGLALGVEATSAVTIDLSMTITNQQNFSAGVNFGVAFAYLVQGTLAAINPTWIAPDSAGIANIASFKAAVVTESPSRRLVASQALARAAAV